MRFLKPSVFSASVLSGVVSKPFVGSLSLVKENECFRSEILLSFLIGSVLSLESDWMTGSLDLVKERDCFRL